jgi:hypothetical protein
LYKFLSVPVLEVVGPPHRPIEKKLMAWRLKTEKRKPESCYIPVSAQAVIAQGGSYPLIG